VSQTEEMLSEDMLVSDSEGLGQQLSQEEIDSLLGISSGDQSSATGIQSLISSSHVTYERLPILEVIFDRLVRTLSTVMRNFTGEVVDISLERMDSTRFGDYIDSLPLPILIGVFEAAEWENQALITADTPLVYSIVDLLMGGRKGPGTIKVEGRPYTTIERSVVERMLSLILEEFTKSFSLFEPVTFKFKSLETNPRFAAIVRPVSACIIVRIKMEMDGRGGYVDFLIPYSTLEPVRGKLLQMVMGEKLGNDNIWEDHFEQEMWSIFVDMEAELGSIMMPLNETLDWEVGSQIIFKEKTTSSVALACSGRPLFYGKLGQREGKVSLKIDRVLQRQPAQF